MFLFLCDLWQVMRVREQILFNFGVTYSYLPRKINIKIWFSPWCLTPQRGWDATLPKCGKMSKVTKYRFYHFGHLAAIIMGNVASYPCSGVRCHAEDQIFILIFLGKYEYVSPKLNRMCFLTPIPVTNHSENKHITAWLLLIYNFLLEGASYPTLPYHCDRMELFLQMKHIQAKASSSSFTN